MGHEVQHLRKKSIPAVQKKKRKTELSSDRENTGCSSRFSPETLTSCRESFCVNSRGTFFPRVEIYHIWNHTRRSREVPLCPTNRKTPPSPPNSIAAGAALQLAATPTRGGLWELKSTLPITTLSLQRGQYSHTSLWMDVYFFLNKLGKYFKILSWTILLVL